MPMVIRAARGADLVAIQRIYNQAVLGTTATWDEEPWPWSQRIDWWDEHRKPGCPVLVSEEEGEVTGFAALSPMSDKSGWRFTRENTVYVDPRFHRRGAGRALMVALLEEARRAGIHLVVASITSDNEASMALHRALGFEVMGTLREAGWKFGRRHDTTYLQLLLDGP